MNDTVFGTETNFEILMLQLFSRFQKLNIDKSTESVYRKKKEDLLPKKKFYVLFGRKLILQNYFTG